MPRPDAKGDCEMVTPVVSHSADDLLGRMRSVSAGEGIETVLATARTLTFTAAVAYWDSLLASRGRAGALPFRYLSFGHNVGRRARAGPGKWRRRLVRVAASWIALKLDTGWDRSTLA